MKIELKYGDRFQEVNIDDEKVIDIIHQNTYQTELSSKNEIKRSLKNPISSKRLKDIVNKNDKVVIITSDITRPCPSSIIIPEIVEELYNAGINSNNIEVVFALGSHRKHTKEEMRQLVGDSIFDSIKCVDSDSDDVINMGHTKNGTPVDIFKNVAEADVRIGVGNIEYHYFAGYSGGAKAIMPGVSTFDAIQKNHSLMLEENAETGNCETNPVRLDIEEAEEFCPLHFIVNVVLNENKEVIKCVSGDFIKAHREGCRFLDSIYKIKVKKKADIVIVSQGGYPKDINLYQLQKALDNSKGVVDRHGIIILLGECKEGFGNRNFANAFMNSNSPEEVIFKIKENFELGAHKAAAISNILLNNDVYLVSDMSEEVMSRCFIKGFSNLQEAYESAKIKTNNGNVIVIPYGGSALPYVEK